VKIENYLYWKAKEPKELDGSGGERRKVGGLDEEREKCNC